MDIITQHKMCIKTDDKATTSSSTYYHKGWVDSIYNNWSNKNVCNFIIFGFKWILILYCILDINIIIILEDNVENGIEISSYTNILLNMVESVYDGNISDTS